MTRYVTYQEVLAYHADLVARFGGESLLIAPDKLRAALARPQATAFGEDAFARLAEKAAALLQGIVIAHPFLDGNKRAGTAAMLAFLELTGVSMPEDSDALYDLVIAVTTGELREVEEIAERLRGLFAGLD